MRAGGSQEEGMGLRAWEACSDCLFALGFLGDELGGFMQDGPSEHGVPHVNWAERGVISEIGG